MSYDIPRNSAPNILRGNCLCVFRDSRAFLWGLRIDMVQRLLNRRQRYEDKEFKKPPCNRFPWKWPEVSPGNGLRVRPVYVVSYNICPLLPEERLTHRLVRSAHCETDLVVVESGEYISFNCFGPIVTINTSTGHSFGVWYGPTIR